MQSLPSRGKGRRFCEPCYAIIMKRLARAAATGSDRDRYYRRTYGITDQAYGMMLDRQDGLCAICRNTPETGTRLVVDHDHTTAGIRGLLCQRCNQGLGMFGDDPANLASAIIYLTVANKHIHLVGGETDELSA